jgi:hypothetical protein
MAMMNGAPRAMCFELGCPNRPIVELRPKGMPAAEPKDSCATHMLEALREDPEIGIKPMPEIPYRFDPSKEQLTPPRVEEELLKLDDTLERLQDWTEAHVNRLAELQLDYDLAYAAAYRASEASSEKGRQHDALLKCRHLLGPLRGAETIVRIGRDRQHNVRASIEVWRSLGASVRVSYGNTR